MSDAKHNTAFTAGGHLHNDREEKKCTLLCQQLFQYYGNARFGKKVKREGVVSPNGGALFASPTHTWNEHKRHWSLPARTRVSDARVAALVGSLQLNCASASAYGAAVYPLSVCCQLSGWKLPFQSSDKKAPRPQTFALRGCTAFPPVAS